MNRDRDPWAHYILLGFSISILAYVFLGWDDPPVQLPRLNCESQRMGPSEQAMCKKIMRGDP